MAHLGTLFFRIPKKQKHLAITILYYICSDRKVIKFLKNSSICDIELSFNKILKRKIINYCRSFYIFFMSFNKLISLPH